MKNRDDYDKAIEVTGAVVRAWDPYNLLEGGASSDEFEAEIAQLVTHIPKISNTADAVQSVSFVFSEAFESELFTPADCATIGESWFKSLTQAGLLKHA
jgi:hypothetical protein